MCPLWLCWALWVLPLAGPGAAVTEEQLLGSLLQRLHLREAPVLDRANVERLAIPAHVRAQYVALLQRSHGDRSRGKRFSQNFREVAGRFLVSEADRHLLVFGMEQRLPPNSELVQAVLRLFQEPVPKAALHRLSPRSTRALVTIEWLRVRDDGSNRTSLIDSRLVSLHESGWKTFDVTEAVNFWQQLGRPRQPLLLQVSVQREHPGPQPSSAHKLVRFAWQGTPGAGHGEPQLELHALDLEDYGAQGDCDSEAPVTKGTRCCRQEMYIDLQGMKWAENWVLEPPGFLAYECVGTCQQPPDPLTSKWPFLGPRQCIASEMASLPVIVSIQEGGRTRPQVVSLPNMRVQKCSCASDGAPMPRRLEP
ncbi:PREDICTED: left-right determination factor 2 isoform X1 [Propithecus coquereli]|uniref:Left-right determination factor n=1 Tax=Propithecus coquereli TaxID=379532 RepID=A0A2K6GWQ1_PROCO|nr:PREDICTED: left-right determination factor 2 isoform X1 [Propithecus coquereli]XP_012499850.1 PREDICTED: left-right determination factor 2 isoform X1 [Propithecus coquereli]